MKAGQIIRDRSDIVLPVQMFLVLAVECGWRRPNEVDRVNFDPRQRTVAQMEQWLKEAGACETTIIGTEPPGEKEKRQ